MQEHAGTHKGKHTQSQHCCVKLTERQFCMFWLLYAELWQTPPVEKKSEESNQAQMRHPHRRDRQDVKESNWEMRQEKQNKWQRTEKCQDKNIRPEFLIMSVIAESYADEIWG